LLLGHLKKLERKRDNIVYLAKLTNKNKRL
jgi:hypothetical protein